MKIYAGCDHAGFKLRAAVMEHLREKGYDVEECMSHELNDDDYYSDAAYEVADKVAKDPNSRGILICGTGIGMSIAANRNRNIRAALCHTLYDAELTRLHNDANVLCLGERVMETELALEIVDKFLTTDFSHFERYEKRIERLK